jgi:hypothetical protein
MREQLHQLVATLSADYKQKKDYAFIFKQFCNFLSLYQQYKVASKSIYESQTLNELIKSQHFFENVIFPHLRNLPENYEGSLFELLLASNAEPHLVQRLSTALYELRQGQDSNDDLSEFQRGLSDLKQIYYIIEKVIGADAVPLADDDVQTLITMTHYSAALFGLGHHYRLLAVSATVISDNGDFHYDESKDKINSACSRNFFKLATNRALQEEEILKQLSKTESAQDQKIVGAQVIAAVNARRHVTDPARKLNPMNCNAFPKMMKQSENLLAIIIDTKKKLKPTTRLIKPVASPAGIEPTLVDHKANLRPVQGSQPSESAPTEVPPLSPPAAPPAPAPKVGGPPPPPPPAPKFKQASTALKITKKSDAGTVAGDTTAAAKPAAAKQGLEITADLLASRQLKKATERVLAAAPATPKGSSPAAQPGSRIDMKAVLNVKLRPKTEQPQTPPGPATGSPSATAVSPAFAAVLKPRSGTNAEKPVPPSASSPSTPTAMPSLKPVAKKSPPSETAGAATPPPELFTHTLRKMGSSTGSSSRLSIDAKSTTPVAATTPTAANIEAPKKA